MTLAFYFDLWIRVLQFLIVVVIGLSLVVAYYECKPKKEHEVKQNCGNLTEK